MKKDFYDLLIIGGGSAGYAAARTAHEEGARVALVDGAKELSGLCILRGCMPSKTLIYSAEVLHLAQKGEVFGFEAGMPHSNLGMMQDRKRKIIKEFSDYRTDQLEDGRFSLFRENAFFLDSHTIKLTGGDILQGKKILLSTGSRIRVPSILGLREVNYKTSDDVLNLTDVPEECVVLGGGVVACELAQFLSRVGSKVTILQRSNRLMKDFPEEASEVLDAQLCSEGIIVRKGVRLEKFIGLENDRIQIQMSIDDQEEKIETGFLFLALGRIPSIDSRNMDDIGIERLKTGHIRTNEFQQSNLPHIYAAGDCAGPHEIVHVAIRQGETAALHACGLSPRPIHYDHLLTVVFTDPQIATVGLNPEDLKRRGIEYISASYPFDDHGKSILMEAKSGYVKVHAEKSTGRVLGAECVGKDAGELIHSLSVAISLCAGVHQLAKADWYHPTLSEIWTYPIEDLAGEIPDPDQKK